MPKKKKVVKKPVPVEKKTEPIIIRFSTDSLNVADYLRVRGFEPEEQIGSTFYYSQGRSDDIRSLLKEGGLLP